MIPSARKRYALRDYLNRRALTMLALGAVWCALHEPARQGRWLAAASLAYGLAVGARPSVSSCCRSGP